MNEAYQRGRRDRAEWFEKNGRSTTIGATEHFMPDNPYPKGSQEHKDYERGSWDERNSLVLVEMGR